jgi:hypothetical protein
MTITARSPPSCTGSPVWRLLSGYACELYDKELYPDWKRIKLPTVADGAKKRTEVLWISPAARGRR